MISNFLLTYKESFNSCYENSFAFLRIINNKENIILKVDINLFLGIEITYDQLLNRLNYYVNFIEIFRTGQK